jgi:hypothetical protein
MITEFSQENYSVDFLVRTFRADAEQLAIGFFGEHDAGRRVQQRQPHGNTVAVGAGVGMPVSAFQKYHFNGFQVFFHKPISFLVSVFGLLREAVKDDH